MTIEIDAATALIKGAVERGVKAAAEQLRSEMIAGGYVPFREGDLQGSFEVEEADGPNGPAAVIGSELIYAARQHEETGWHHPVQGQAKYLSAAAADSAQELAEVIATHVRGQM